MSGEQEVNFCSFFDACTKPKASKVPMWFHATRPLPSFVGCQIRASTSCLMQNEGGSLGVIALVNSHWWVERLVWNNSENILFIKSSICDEEISGRSRKDPHSLHGGIFCRPGGEGEKYFWYLVLFIYFYYIKYSALQRFWALIKLIISHVRLFMIISHVKIIAFQLSLFCKNYRFSKTVLYIINRKMLGNTRFISRVEHDMSLVRCAHSWDIMFNTRNKSGISAHPCIILYINFIINRTIEGTDNRTEESQIKSYLHITLTL